jgi:hypothetical protein
MVPTNVKSERVPRSHQPRTRTQVSIVTCYKMQDKMYPNISVSGNIQQWFLRRIRVRWERNSKAREPWQLYSWIPFTRMVATSESFQMLLQTNMPTFGIFFGSLMVEKHFGERQLRQDDPPIQNIFRWFFSTVSSEKFTVLSFGFEIILIDNSPQSNNSNQMNLIDYNDL